jgi:hypothetical protein
MENPQENKQGNDDNREYGEGNYAASKEYQRGATKTARKGTEQAAGEAKRAMQNPKERKALEEAAEKAKRGRR